MSSAFSTGDEKAVFLDIGGNVGWFSTFAAAAGHRTETFEPMASNSALIKQSIKANPGFKERLSLHEHGLTDGETTNCGFITSSTNQGDGQIACGSELERKKAEQGVVSKAFQLKRLDDVLQHVPRIDVVKIDVEGHELQALRGGEKMLRKWRPKVIFTEYVDCCRFPYQDCHMLSLKKQQEVEGP